MQTWPHPMSVPRPTKKKMILANVCKRLASFNDCALDYEERERERESARAREREREREREIMCV
jgi:hypothetical protein